MSDTAAHNSLWRTFDAFFVIALVLGIGLQFAMPLSFTPPVRPIVLDIGGAIGLIIGLALILAARRQLALANQPAKPGAPTTELVEDGIFTLSRNPIYLGGVLFMAGLAMFFDAPWLAPATAGLILAAHYLLILPEERYLGVRFKARYGDYCERVRRWF
jgi:protein-S-isoprenylcysteine O-methyltransferase Ste14